MLLPIHKLISFYIIIPLGKSESASSAAAVANTNKDVSTMVFGGLPPAADPLEPASFGQVIISSIIGWFCFFFSVVVL